MKTIFSKIISREIPAQFVYEDEHCVAILDVFPTTPGQTLIIPRTPTPYLFDLEDDLYQHLLSVAKKIARALDIVFDTERTCLVVEGFEVPHAHIKLYPTTTPELKITGGEKATEKTLIAHAQKIKRALK